METHKFDLQVITNTAREILKDYESANMPDRCNTLIYLCIGAGMTTGNEIVGCVRVMAPDLNNRFIGMLLNRPLRAASGEPFWRKDSVAGYVLN